MAPTTSQPPACRKSWRAVPVNDAQRLSPSTTRPRARVIQASRPIRLQMSPTTIEVSSEARKRARTISGRPGKATAVDTSTTGLIAGAASMKVNAAAGETPLARSRAAIGTEAHSQPGRAAPARPAAGTASASCLGRALASQPGGTRAAMAPEMSTPRTRNGRAWMTIDTSSVDQNWTAEPSKNSATRPRLPSPTATSSTSSSTLNRRGRRFAVAAGGDADEPASRTGSVRPPSLRDAHLPCCGSSGSDLGRSILLAGLA